MLLPYTFKCVWQRGCVLGVGVMRVVMHSRVHAPGFDGVDNVDKCWQDVDELKFAKHVSVAAPVSCHYPAPPIHHPLRVCACVFVCTQITHTGVFARTCVSVRLALSVPGIYTDLAIIASRMRCAGGHGVELKLKCVQVHQIVLNRPTSKYCAFV